MKVVKDKKLVTKLQTDFSLGSEAEAIALAVKDRNGEASLGKAAELAGVPVGQMMTILTGFGVT